ncbi:MAG: A1 family peptidase [archaeon]|nr:A1 family peptidase [archaeon]
MENKRKLIFYYIYIFTFIFFSLFDSDYFLQFDLISTGSILNKDKNKKYLRKLEETPFDSEDNKYHIMTIPICLGDPRQCFYFAYDTGVMYVIAGGSNRTHFKSIYEYSKSLTFRTITNDQLVSLAYGSGAIQAREVSDYILLPQFPTPLYSLNFLLAYETTSSFPFDGILGLGGFYPPKGDGLLFDERFSFVKYLKFNKLIEDRIFAHEYTDRDHGKFYIGEIPHKRNEYFNCSSMFFFEPLIYKWHCDLKEVIFSDGKSLTMNSNFASFATGSINIIAPAIEGNELFEYIVRLSNDKCNINSEEEGVKKLLCDTSFTVSKIPNLNFRFTENNLTLIFYNEDMFRLIEIKGERKLFFKITVIEKNEGWTLGEPILKNYNMFFDYDTETIGFIPNINNEGERWEWVLFLALSLIAIFIGVILIFKNRKVIIFKLFKSKEIEKLNDPNAFDEGHQLGDIQ